MSKGGTGMMKCYWPLWTSFYLISFHLGVRLSLFPPHLLYTFITFSSRSQRESKNWMLSLLFFKHLYKSGSVAINISRRDSSRVPINPLFPLTMCACKDVVSREWDEVSCSFFFFFYMDFCYCRDGAVCLWSWSRGPPDHLPHKTLSNIRANLSSWTVSLTCPLNSMSLT